MRRKAKKAEEMPQFVIALAGNPNVGKSTVFNELTGLKQHTGNWPGKTVASASGEYQYNFNNYLVVDLPGTYSLLAHSAEEEVARDFLCFGGATAVVIVMDTTCVERNLNLVLQTLEITKNVVICLNLMDEAKKKNIFVDRDKLSELLGVPVVCATARSGKGINELLQQIHLIATKSVELNPVSVKYLRPIEEAVAILELEINSVTGESVNSHFVALRLIENDESLNNSIMEYLGFDILKNEKVKSALAKAKKLLNRSGIDEEKYRDKIVSCLVMNSEKIAKQTVKADLDKAQTRDRRLDRLFTGKLTGVPIMILLLLFVFWITIFFSNYPSGLLQDFMQLLLDKFHDFAEFAHMPFWLSGLLFDGIFKVLGWVVAVMLPPMAIFFPLFTLLEDFGYLPRVAFNLDNCFKKANTCGKQALTTCMGFGCNAAAIAGARIIDSPRERLIAIITNSFVPCNGRFPLLISVITMFFVSATGGFSGTISSSLILTLIIVFSISMTFLASKILSVTILKCIPSSFTLELPPYRRPQIGKVIVRSIFDRTLFVLGRAIVVAAPAGLVIWLMANINCGGTSLLLLCSDFLDPFASLFGMDGIILMAFILGFPANEIVIPIILMAYMSAGNLTDYASLAELKTILVDNGWTWITAISVMLFSLMHWPCSTTCLTIKKETGSWKWTLASVAVPTICGFAICFLFNLIAKIFV